MKICLQCQTLSVGKGGTERVAAELAHEMSARGHKVSLCYKDYGKPSYNILKDVEQIPYTSLHELAGALEKIDPDVFFSFYVNHFVIQYYSIVHGKNIPFGIQECTNPDRIIYNNWDVGRRDKHSIEWRSWEREVICAGAHRIRLTMPAYLDSLPDYIRSNAKAFPNPAVSQFRIAKPSGKDSGQKIIINVGGMKDNKNLITLLKAFSLVSESYPEWIINVFGKPCEGDEPYILEIREFIRSHGLQERVVFRGPVDDIFSEYAKSQIHVISSLSEGCPTCVLEAMATGLPSIGFSDCPGTNRLIRHGINGILASGHDRVQNLSNALDQLMKDSELRQKMGLQALADSADFNPKMIYDQWEQLFFEAAGYKNDTDRLVREQMAVDRERALHARRMRDIMVRKINE